MKTVRFEYHHTDSWEVKVITMKENMGCMVEEDTLGIIYRKTGEYLYEFEPQVSMLLSTHQLRMIHEVVDNLNKE